VANTAFMLATCFLIGFLSDPEDGGYMFLWNVGWIERNTRRYIPQGTTLDRSRIVQSIREVQEIVSKPDTCIFVYLSYAIISPFVQLKLLA
jgi:hypothetical protein